MNTQKPFLSLLVIPTLLLSSTSLSAASTNSEIKVIDVGLAIAGKFDKSTSDNGEMATELAKMGKLAQALEVGLTRNNQAATALQLAELVQTPEYDPDLSGLFGEIGANFVKLGEFERALEIAQFLDEYYNEGLNWLPLREIARELVAAGQVEEALELTRNRNDAAYHQSQILIGIAGQLAANGDLNRALEIAESFEHGLTKAQAIGQIALDLIEAKQFTQGMQVTQSLLDSVEELDYNRAIILEGIAVTLAREKQFDLAMEVAAMLDVPSSDESAFTLPRLHFSALQSIAILQAQAGNVR